MENNIIKHKTEADRLEAAIHEGEMENQSLKRQYEENHAYQELQKRQADLKKIVNENTALAETISSDDFIKSNQKLIDVIKEQEKEKLRNDLLRKKRQKEQELINAKIALQSQPDEKYTKALTDQVSQEIGKIEQEIFITNSDIQEAKEPIERYEYMVQKLKEAKRKNIDANLEYSAIQAKQSKISAEANDELQKNIEKQMVSLGRQQASNEKANMKTKNSHDILMARMEAARQKAYSDEINKPIPEEDEQKFKEAGVLEAQTNAQKQLNEVTLNNRRAMFALAKAKANNDYYDSKEMKALNDQITNLEISTKNLQRQTEERDIMAKTQKKMQEAQIADSVIAHTLQNELSEVDQVDYLVSEHLEPKLNEFKEKDELMQELLQLTQTHPDAWKVFIEGSPTLQGLLSGGNYRNVPIDELRDIIKLFTAFWKQPQQQPDEEENNFLD